MVSYVVGVTSLADRTKLSRLPYNVQRPREAYAARSARLQQLKGQRSRSRGLTKLKLERLFVTRTELAM